MKKDYFSKYEWTDKLILIVEDDASSIYFLKEVLNFTKAKLIIVNNGKDAVEQCNNNSEIDLVLMDIQLPGMDGYKTTIEIKNLHPDLPIIAQTAYALADDCRKCFAVGCSDYISKPIDPSILLEKMNFFLDDRSTPTSLD